MNFFKNMAMAFVAIVAINSLNAAESGRRGQQKGRSARTESRSDRAQNKFIREEMELSCSYHDEAMYNALSARRFSEDALCRAVDKIVSGNSIAKQAVRDVKNFPQEPARIGNLFSQVMIERYSTDEDWGMDLSQAKKDAIKKCVNKTMASMQSRSRK